MCAVYSLSSLFPFIDFTYPSQPTAPFLLPKGSDSEMDYFILIFYSCYCVPLCSKPNPYHTIYTNFKEIRSITYFCFRALFPPKTYQNPSHPDTRISCFTITLPFHLQPNSFPSLPNAILKLSYFFWSTILYSFSHHRKIIKSEQHFPSSSTAVTWPQNTNVCMT